MAAIEALASLPVFLALDGQTAIVAGEGAGVAWKAELAAAAGARVKLYCAHPSSEVEAAAADIAVELMRRSWSSEDFAGAAVAILDARDDVEAGAFRDAAKRAGALVNVVDRPKFCDFSFGAIVNRSPLVVAISTNGAAPVLGQMLRARLETMLPEALSDWSQAAARLRETIAAQDLDFRARRAFWQSFAEQALAAGDSAPDLVALQILARGASAQATARRGRITWVGAGPAGDLITMRGVRALQGAQAIIYDEEAPAEALQLARRESLRRPFAKGLTREEAVARLTAYALGGRAVVRLTAGDPAHDGAAAGEMAIARAAGVDVDLAPGVAAESASAKPALRLYFQTEASAAGPTAQQGMLVAIYVRPGSDIAASADRYSPARLIRDVDLLGGPVETASLGDLTEAIAALDQPALLLLDATERSP